MSLAQVIAFDIEAVYDGCACCKSKETHEDFQETCGPLQRRLWVCRDCGDELREERARSRRSQGHIGWRNRVI